MAKENIIIDKTFEFSLRIIELYKYFTIEKKEYILSKQLLKYATSIGANVEEATAAQSRKDFLSKMSIASKEARETTYWLRLLIKSDYITDDGILNNSIEIKKIITSIVKTTSAQKD